MILLWLVVLVPIVATSGTLAIREGNRTHREHGQRTSLSPGQQTPE